MRAAPARSRDRRHRAPPRPALHGACGGRRGQSAGSAPAGVGRPHHARAGEPRGCVRVGEPRFGRRSGPRTEDGEQRWAGSGTPTAARPRAEPGSSARSPARTRTPLRTSPSQSPAPRHALGVLQQQQGENEAATRSFERALELWRADGQEAKIAQELNSLGVTKWASSEPVAARAHFEESILLARRCGDEARVASALSNLGLLTLGVGSPEEAVGYFEQALRIDQLLQNPWGEAVDRINIGAALARTDVARAHTVLVDVLQTSLELDDPDLVANTIECLALAAGTAGKFRHAIVLVAAADALRAIGSDPARAGRRRLPRARSRPRQSRALAGRTGLSPSRGDPAARRGSRPSSRARRSHEHRPRPKASDKGRGRGRRRDVGEKLRRLEPDCDWMLRREVQHPWPSLARQAPSSPSVRGSCRRARCTSFLVRRSHDGASILVTR